MDVNINADANRKATPHNLAAAMALGVVVLLGSWQFIGALRNPDGLKFPKSSADFWEGRSTQTLEKQIDHKLPARERIIAFANSVRYVLTGGGGDQVRVGKSDWLFLTDELRYDTREGNPMGVRVDLLGDASKALAERGVKLVVALVPDKARVYASQLPAGRYPEYNASRYADGLGALRARGVTVVDLLSPLSAAAQGGDVYYRSDTHWNQKGAQVAAQSIAKVASGLGVQWTPIRFTSQLAGKTEERPGDLIRLMGLEHVSNALRPRPDMEALATTAESSAQSGGGLFGDAAVPIVLTGTSYSMRGNFQGYLQEALSSKVLNTAKDGCGFLQATTNYLKDEAFKSSKPSILIWELPERFLHQKIEQEKKWLSQVGLTP